MNSSKKIEINRSTLVSLKAELTRKQEEVKQTKSLAGLSRALPRTVKKSTGVWSRQNKGVEGRDQLDEEVTQEEADQLKQSRSALEEKARLYDQLCNPNTSREETAKADSVLLVNFKQKQQEKEREEEEGEWPSDASDQDDEWVDYQDCLGRTRRCLRADFTKLQAQDARLASSLGVGEEPPPSPPPPPVPVPSPPPLDQQLVSGVLHREALREKWQKEEEGLRDKDDVHYQDLLYDEVRNHGVSYFGFSKDEKQRRAQQETLAKVRVETKKRQVQALDAKKRREQQLRARLRAAANRKRERQGLPPLPESDGEAERGGASDEEAEVERLLLGGRAREPPPPPEPEPMTREEPTLPAVPRPWDLDKEKPVLTQEEWNEQQRAMRHSEFAPPSTSLQGFHAGGKFLLDTTPRKKKQPEPVKKQDDQAPLTIPRKSKPKPIYKSDSSDDEMIGPLPPTLDNIVSFPTKKKDKFTSKFSDNIFIVSDTKTRKPKSKSAKNKVVESVSNIQIPDMSMPPPDYSVPPPGFSIPPPFIPNPPSTSTVPIPSATPQNTFNPMQTPSQNIPIPQQAMQLPPFSMQMPPQVPPPSMHKLPFSMKISPLHSSSIPLPVPPPTQNWDIPTPVPAPNAWKSSFNPVGPMRQSKPKRKWSDKPPETETKLSDIPPESNTKLSDIPPQKLGPILHESTQDTHKHKWSDVPPEKVQKPHWSEDTQEFQDTHRLKHTWSDDIQDIHRLKANWLNEPAEAQPDWSDEPSEDARRGKGVEIAPPTTMEYHIGSRRNVNKSGPAIPPKKAVESAIAAGLSFLRKKAEKKDQNKTKLGMFDVI